MQRRLLVAALAGAAAALPGTASATSLGLAIQPQRGLLDNGIVKGVHQYRAQVGSIFANGIVGITDDQGAPFVSACAGSAKVHLLNGTTELGNGAACTDANGRTTIYPAGSKFVSVPLLGLHATVDAGSNFDGSMTLSPASSNPVAIYLAPKLIDTSVSTHHSSSTYPIKGKIVAAGNVSKLGQVIVQRRNGRRWKTVFSKAPTTHGKFSASLFLTGEVTIFREFFSASKNGGRAGWVSSAPIGFKITKRI